MMRNIYSTLSLAALLISPLAIGGQNFTVCRDAEGNSYFTDRRDCPQDTTEESRGHVSGAQSYSGRESINTQLLNNYERRNGSDRRWRWR